MIKITKEHKYFQMGNHIQPAARVHLPATIILQTNDCYDGDMSPDKDCHIKDIDLSRGNPTTGPVYFEGVVPGDVLEIHIDKIKMASPGFSFCGVNEGFLQEESGVEELRWYHFDDEGINFGRGIKLPLMPMIGEIGVAPADGPIRNLYPGDYGGNMDTSLIKEGSILFLPVFQDGAYLGCGDLHAAMGDGESFYEGIECAGEVQLTIKVRKDLDMDIPYVIADGKFASIGTDETIEKALRKSMSKLLHFLSGQLPSLSVTDISYILGFYGNLEISQVVDPLMTGRMSISMDILKKIGLEII